MEVRKTFLTCTNVLERTSMKVRSVCETSEPTSFLGGKNCTPGNKIVNLGRSVGGKSHCQIRLALKSIFGVRQLDVAFRQSDVLHVWQLGSTLRDQVHSRFLLHIFGEVRTHARLTELLIHRDFWKELF